MRTKLRSVSKAGWILLGAGLIALPACSSPRTRSETMELRKPAAAPEDAALIEKFVQALTERSALEGDESVDEVLTRIINRNAKKLSITKIRSLDDIAAMSDTEQTRIIEKLAALPELTKRLQLDSEAVDLARAKALQDADTRPVEVQAVPDLQREPVDMDAALAFARKKQKLLDSTQFWEKFLGRQITETEFRRSKMSAFITGSIRTDRPYIIINYLQPMTYDVRLAYALLEQTESRMAGPGLAPGELAALKDQASGYARTIALKLDDYSSAFGTLQKYSQGTGTVAKNATTILQNLDTRNLLRTFFDQSGLAPQDTPTLQQLHAVLDRYPGAELARLSQIRRMEAFSALLSVSPTQTVFNSIGKWASDIPGADAGKIRLFLSSLEDEKIQYLYFPNIQRIAQSEGTIQDKLKMLQILNASTEDEFIKTLARRVDLRDLWNQLLAQAKSGTDQAFYQRMVTAQAAASKLDDLALWHDTSKMTLVAHFVDAVVASAIGYFGYEETLGRPKPPQTGSTAQSGPQGQMSPSDTGEFDRIIGWIEAAVKSHFTRAANG